ncbi:MAG: hypothetical protein Q8P57_03905 [Candidatus Pacearchaeota archaeon]|nr:hypothetical protein [Candidatus Pacearchaeota archaeon]
MVVEWLSFVALVVYAYLTYLIAKDIYNPLVSFSIKQIKEEKKEELTHLGFTMVNKSKVEVEVFGKLLSKVNNELFEFKDGFYGDKKHWILQPFTEGFGHFYLKDLTNKYGVKLEDFVKNNKISSIDFDMQIKYRRVVVRNGRVYKKIAFGKWKITSPQNFVYNFDKNLFWLNV